MALRVDVELLDGSASALCGQVTQWSGVRINHSWPSVGGSGSPSVAGEMVSVNDWYKMTWALLEDGATGLAQAAQGAAATYAASEEFVARAFSSPEYIV